jgi:hypothetical protein
MVNAPASPAFKLLVASFLVLEGGGPFHNVLTLIFRILTEDPDYLLHDLQLYGLPEDPAGCPLLPQT